jgi:DNA-directed RNA polymerase sigma subunit (sigma70/sigma32)
VTKPDLPDFDYEAVLASLTEADRQYLFETYGVPLDATTVDSTYLQLLVTVRRIKQIETAAIAKFCKSRHTGNNFPPASDC